MKTLAVFSDIEIRDERQVPYPDVTRLDKVKQFQIGQGTKVWRADRRGMWLGSDDFSTAPFRVDMDGNTTGLTFTGVTITGSTIIGSIIKTSDTGDRVEMNNTENSLDVYVGGDLRVRVASGQITFLGAGEVGSGSIVGFGTNNIIISTGGQDFSFTDSGLSIGDRYIWSGIGSPEGAVIAPVGSMWLRTDGGASTTLYIKESGTGATGWVAK